jgi:hypothetical protein
MEYWVEENITPNRPGDMDKILSQHIRHMVNVLKSRKLVVTWHFFRESNNWRGNGNIIPHIRFRIRTHQRKTKLQDLRDYLTIELDRLQSIGEISDHYRGNHGNPNQEYQGEGNNFNEVGPNPEGWKVTQKWLEAGSEIALNLIRARLTGVRYGQRFIPEDLLHFIANQNGYYNVMNRTTRQFLIQL